MRLNPANPKPCVNGECIVDPYPPIWEIVKIIVLGR